MHHGFVDFFCFTVPKTFARRTIVFQKRYGIEKKLFIKARVSRFSVGFFCLAMPKNFGWEPFCVPEKTRY